jgi:hypothetical protein
MIQEWNGHWYLSDASIRTLLGERLPVILEAFRQVKTELALYLRNPNKIDVEQFIKQHKASMVVALQVDGLAQTSLQVEGKNLTLFTVVDGNSVTKAGRIQSTVPRPGSAMLMVRDDEDGEHSTFIWKEGTGTLSTVDQGIEMVFSREPRFFFTDPELDVMEQLLEWIQSEE